MIYDGAELRGGGRLATDLCVIGSGPGGLAAATIAAEAGAKVVLLEQGALLTPGDMNQREDDMLPRLLWHAGARTTDDRGVRVVGGRGVGGSTLHNINLCKRIPTSIIERWDLERLGVSAWSLLYDEVEAMLSVSTVPKSSRNRPNLLLEAGCRSLGWRGGELQHNRTGCLASGFCELGCAYDAKNNALKVLAPRFLRAGGQIVTHAQAVRIEHDGERVAGVDVRLLDATDLVPRGRLRVEAPKVCVAASATGTPGLLLRSRIPDDSGTTGKGLRIHPAVIACGDFPEPVHAWLGIPQSYECTEWLTLDGEQDAASPRTWIVPAFGHPMTTAALIPGHGAAHADLMQRYPHLCAFTAMLHDRTQGEVSPKGDLDVSLNYWPDEADRAELMRGLARCARLLFAAGATRVFVGGHPLVTLDKGSDLEALAASSLERGVVDLSAVHPMASVAMGNDRRRAAVDSAGRHHYMNGLWAADGSLFPTSIGVPPQVSIYALGLHVGRALVSAG